MKHSGAGLQLPFCYMAAGILAALAAAFLAGAAGAFLRPGACGKAAGILVTAAVAADWAGRALRKRGIARIKAYQSLSTGGAHRCYACLIAAVLLAWAAKGDILLHLALLLLVACDLLQCLYEFLRTIFRLRHR